MSNPLRNANPQPRDLQFKHFGVLNAGNQSKSSVVTAVAINVAVAFILVVLSAAAIKTAALKKSEEVVFVPPLPPPPPPPPKLIPPKPLPKPPVITPLEPKIVLPKGEPMEAPKPVPVAQPKPLPVVTPAPPKRELAAAAPKPMPVKLPTSASVVNRDANPRPVVLGQQNNPIAPSNRPAVSAVNMGNAGMAGMPAGTSGRGPQAQAVNMGSGRPGGSVGGNSSRPSVQGVNLGGVPGGTTGSKGNGLGVQQVQLARQATPSAAATPSLMKAPARTGPQVLYKPRPVYTAEATALKIEGVVQVRIRVSSTGAVTVLGVTSGLGHGLDESAMRAVQGTKFRPAVDANGNPTDWEGVVNISFQIAT